jgi:hypothetical protein
MMACSLVLFHMLAMLASSTAFPLRGIANISAAVVTTLITIIFSHPLTYYRVEHL